MKPWVGLDRLVQLASLIGEYGTKEKKIKWQTQIS